MTSKSWVLLVSCVAIVTLATLTGTRGASAQPASCPTPPPTPSFTKDFTPNGPRAPTPKGNLYKLKADDISSGSQGLDAMEYAIYLQFFYNGFGRSPARATDAMLWNDVFTAAVRSQDEVQNDIHGAQQAAQRDARDVFQSLQCGQRGEYTRRASRVGVPANETSYGLHLTIGSFSIYWESKCEIGPKECCVDDASCDSGRAHRAPYSCKINFTLFDNYNFGSKTGTGGTGWLKRMNPAGWLGTAFDQFGTFSIRAEGVARACVDPAKVQTECCQPSSQEPETHVDPGRGGEVAQPGHDGEKVGETVKKPDCPECVPIAEALAKAKGAVAEAKLAITRIQGLLGANHQSHQQLGSQLDAFEKDVGQGWTASGTDVETGVTKSYDATKGDGQVHVTVTDKSGQVLRRYDYPRSKNKAEAGRRVEQMKALLAALEQDEAQLKEDDLAARKNLAAAEAEVARLTAELDACLKRCHSATTDPDRRTSLGPGERPFFVQPTGGAALGIGNQASGGLLGVVGGYRVIPNGYVVFAPEFTFASNNTIIALPLGFQFDVPVPAVPGLFVYPRGTLGYAVDLFSLEIAGQRFSDTNHALTLGAVGGAKFLVGDRFFVAAEPVGLTGYVSNGTGWIYRAAIAAGARLP